MVRLNTVFFFVLCGVVVGALIGPGVSHFLIPLRDRALLSAPARITLDEPTTARLYGTIRSVDLHAKTMLVRVASPYPHSDHVLLRLRIDPTTLIASSGDLNHYGLEILRDGMRVTLHIPRKNGALRVEHVGVSSVFD